jgi:hypothetical protein
MPSNHNILKRLDPPKDRSSHWVRGLESTHAHLDDRALAIFQVDTLLRYQYLATFKRKILLSPEKTLMLAVLQDAVVCFQDHAGAQDKRKRRLFLEAEEWIMSQDSFYLFCFENVCASLGFDAGYLRRGMMSWKNKTFGLDDSGKMAS